MSGQAVPGGVNSPGNTDFSDEQKNYLLGFWSGFETARTRSGGPTWSAVLGLPPHEAAPLPESPESVHRLAQDRWIAQGKKLSAEEESKRKSNPLDAWDDIVRHATEDRFPRGLDVFRFKFHGLFYVAPAQDAYMCRLRLPAGVLTAAQLRGVAEVAEELAGGYADVTTRANLQLREIKAQNAIALLERLHELGIVPRGAGADNLRNITASPTAGFDSVELIDTRPLARELHHLVLHHRELHGLPRKFNVAFDGGGRVTALEDTNDIGFAAVRAAPGGGSPPGVYFRALLGGITGHHDFARDTGLLLAPAQCVPLAVAMMRVFIDHGDRTDRRKARLKYLLDRWGHERFVEESLGRAGLAGKVERLPLEKCERRAPVDRLGHIGVHEARQPGYRYVGVLLPVGRMTARQMRALAATTDRHAGGEVRLTVWQNLLVPGIAADRVPAVLEELHTVGLTATATPLRAGLVACTGSKGCKYAAADTKGHALELARRLESRVPMDTPINVHLTGCPHSCAQHTIGDIGCLGATVARGEESVEGYHVFVGGGHGEGRAIAHEIYRDVPADELPTRIEAILRSYLEHRRDAQQPFRDFVAGKSAAELRALFDRQEVVT